MSSSVATNYGGKVGDTQQTIKQFYVSTSSSMASWIYKKFNNGFKCQMPADSKYAVLIDNDLIVTGSIFHGTNIQENVQPIEYSSDIFQLNPIQFELKKDPVSKKVVHYGLNVDEVNVLFPELVGSHGINYIELVPLMLDRMKYMQQEIDDLKSREV